MDGQVGRVIRFDTNKGFGFIAPDGGGDDVFLHASAVIGDPQTLRQGMKVEFESIESAQGLKAITARAVHDAARFAVRRTRMASCARSSRSPSSRARSLTSCWPLRRR